MNFEWIRREFGYSYERDYEAAVVLSRYLHNTQITWRKIESIIKGRDVCVLGPHKLDIEEIFHPLIVADDGLSSLKPYGIIPDILVTDLDCSEDIMLYIPSKTIVVVHAHGDNIDKIDRFVSKFKNVVGTCQTEDVGEVKNIGGFTDGDRAVVLAHLMRARQIKLVGFNFDEPVRKEGKDLEIKRKKLRWAKLIIEEIGRERNQKLL